MYLSVPFENGESVVVELSDDQGSGVVRASRGEGLIASSVDTFEAGLTRIRHVAEAVVNRLTGLPRSPDRIRAEFGIKVTAEAGLVVAKGSGDAHITLELEWSRHQGDE
ncbi:CU044_2847 family protein [Streptomyces sp. NPDC050516]|uniref:CU044_2847 family protein n=1 Tax=Streptomyces sp. NPDC050516 TaxID=3365621 RepID=UPI0037A38FE5